MTGHTECERPHVSLKKIAKGIRRPPPVGGERKSPRGGERLKGNGDPHGRTHTIIDVKRGGPKEKKNQQTAHKSREEAKNRGTSR